LPDVTRFLWVKECYECAGKAVLYPFNSLDNNMSGPMRLLVWIANQ